VTYLTLAHFSKNSAATPGLGRGCDQVSGLTGFGRELVAELERAGVFVDVAHVNRPGVLDVCKIARRPVICTHTTSQAVRAHDRGVTDEAAQAIAATGGIIGVMAAPNFMADSLRATTAVVCDHIEHLASVVGVAHMAIGTDLDGWLPTIPSDMRDCRDAVKILDGLRARGWSEPDIQSIAWGNALRVLSAQAG
jgi:membrane dipeptidase